MYIIVSRQKAPVNRVQARVHAATFPHIHDTFQQAKTEAERLAKKDNSKEFVVFQATAGFRLPDVAVETFVPEVPQPIVV